MTDYKLTQTSIVDELAQWIRQVDGDNKMGAGGLAEKICERFHVDAPDVQGEPVAWLGWGCQYPGKMPRLYGDRRIAELNCDWESGDQVLHFTAAPQPAEQQPDPSDMQIIAITTAYEQGVGKGHDAHHRGVEIQNPYGPSWGCDKAWQWGYEEGKEQAAKPQPAPDVSALVEALELISDTDPDEETAWFHEVAHKALATLTIKKENHNG